MAMERRNFRTYSPRIKLTDEDKANQIQLMDPRFTGISVKLALIKYGKFRIMLNQDDILSV